jgi:deazaflavin-dependent oxidoreductase (nitroreductase family)
MPRRIIAAAALAALASAAAVIVIESQAAPPDPGAATRHDRLRALNRTVTNPLMLQAARLGLRYPAVVEHRGRSSGRVYETPVAVVEAGERFIIPLPYGEGTDWCRNVLAAGGCTLRYRNRPVALAAPQIAGPEDVAADAGEARMNLWRRFGIDRYLVLWRAAQADA